MSDEVLLDVDGAVARLSFNRPDLGNAVTPEQAGALRDRLEELVADPQVRVIVLTGSGSTFNVGASRRPGDTIVRAGTPEPDPVTRYQAQIPVMLRVIELLTDPRCVTIAEINGGCAGAGLAVALACDLRYAAATARFSTGFLAAGLSGELGAIWFAVREVGAGRARELFLLPERTDAASLAAIGLLTGVVEPDDLPSAVAAVAQRLAAYPATPLTAMKANFGYAASASLDDYLRFELDGMVRSLSERAVTPTQDSGTQKERTQS